MRAFLVCLVLASAVHASYGGTFCLAELDMENAKV